MYIEADGTILAEAIYDGYIVREHIIGWEGGRLARVSRAFMPEDAQPGQVMALGPYRVRLIEQYPWFDGWLVLRIDRWAWFYFVKYKVMRTLELFTQRFILTLAIWQLAEVPIGAYPSWCDIKLVKWFGKKLERKAEPLDV